MTHEHDDELLTPEENPQRPGAGLFEWLQTITVCILAAVVLFNCVCRLSRVDGSSMDPTLEHGEMLLVWSLGYTPKQGDIVVLNKTTATLPGWDGKLAIIKRVIATGGQTVDIDYVNSVVYVDGKALEEDYILEEMCLPFSSHMSQTRFEVPEGSVFVMGDNRNNSADSRDDRLGPVDADFILGKAAVALWPLSSFGTI